MASRRWDASFPRPASAGIGARSRFLRAISVAASSIEFDGVFRDCVVFCNGYVVGRNESGYAPFSIDLTDFIEYGARNVIAVRVDATTGEGWFYEGAGIYRHVWLVKTAALHVPKWGVFVRPQLAAGTRGAAHQHRDRQRRSAVAAMSLCAHASSVRKAS